MQGPCMTRSSKSMIFEKNKLVLLVFSAKWFDLPATSVELLEIKENVKIYYCASLQIDGLVQDCSISSANALEILQSCTKPSRYFSHKKLTDLVFVGHKYTCTFDCRAGRRWHQYYISHQSGWPQEYLEKWHKNDIRYITKETYNVKSDTLVLYPLCQLLLWLQN